MIELLSGGWIEWRGRFDGNRDSSGGDCQSNGPSALLTEAWPGLDDISLRMIALLGSQADSPASRKFPCVPACSQFRLDRKSLMLAVFIALLCPGERLLADSVSSALLDAEAHAKLCKCATRCHGDSCCCGRSLRSRSRESRRCARVVRSSERSSRVRNACIRRGAMRRPGSSRLPGRLHRVTASRR